jgi:phospholipid/cholesterol/gamma-HCH transport system ATP-binding protein
MIRLQNVTYAVAGQEILRGIDLEVKRNETVVILGASGSGKSTILRLILGLIEPTLGSIQVLGQDLGTLNYTALVQLRKKMGIVFQEGALFDSLTVGENVGYFFMEHDRQSHAQVEPRVMEMLATVGLAHTIDYWPEQLSGGMRRRIGIARALIYRPELILYDEPTTGLDPVASDSILDLIQKLKREHRVTSIVVTHDLEVAAQIADRLLVIRNGSVVWSGTKRSFVAQQKKIVSLYYQSERELSRAQ